MSDPCRSMRESKRKKTSDITLLKRKLEGPDGVADKSVKEDIYAAQQAIKQLTIDIKACMEKNKKPKKEAVKLKQITPTLTTSLESKVNEPSHSTGSRKQVS